MRRGFQGFQNFIDPEAPVPVQFGLTVGNAEIGKRTVARLAGKSNDFFQRVVGLARDRIENVARSEQTEQPDGERVCPADDGMTDKRRLGPHQIRKDLIQRFAPFIVEPVAAAGLKHGIRNPMVSERIHHAPGVGKGDGFNFGKAGSKRLFRLCGKFGQFL